MRVYHFTETALPRCLENHAGKLARTLPEIGRLDSGDRQADLLHRYYDEWALAERLGLDVR